MHCFMHLRVIDCGRLALGGFFYYKIKSWRVSQKSDGFWDTFSMQQKMENGYHSVLHFHLITWYNKV